MASTYTLISSNVLSSSAASVTFSAIPSTYTDLVLRCSTRSDDPSIFLRFNGSTTTYSTTELAGDGSSPYSLRNTAGTGYIYVGDSDGSADTANTFGSFEIYIPNYTAAQNKPLSTFSARERNTTLGILNVTAGLWRNTSAIDSIFLKPNDSTGFVSGSSFYLYGIRSA